MPDVCEHCHAPRGNAPIVDEDGMGRGFYCSTCDGFSLAAEPTSMPAEQEDPAKMPAGEYISQMERLRAELLAAQERRQDLAQKLGEAENEIEARDRLLLAAQEREKDKDQTILALREALREVRARIYELCNAGFDSTRNQLGAKTQNYIDEALAGSPSEKPGSEEGHG